MQNINKNSNFSVKSATLYQKTLNCIDKMQNVICVVISKVFGKLADLKLCVNSFIRKLFMSPFVDKAIPSKLSGVVVNTMKNMYAQT